MLARNLQPAANTTAMGTPGTPDAGVDGMLQSIWRHKWVVVAALVASTIIGTIVAARSVPMYPSYSKLLFDQTRSKILGGEQSAITDLFLHSQSEQIGSQDILDRAAKSLIDRNDVAANPMSGPPLRLFPKNMTQQAATNLIRQGLDVSVGKDDGILTVSFRSPYPLESQAVVEAVVNSYIGYENDTHKDKTAQSMEHLLKQQQVYNDQETADRIRIEQFRKANPDVTLAPSQGMVVQRSRVADQYDTARLATVAAKAELDQFVATVPPAATQPSAAIDDDDVQLNPQSVADQLGKAEAALLADQNSGYPENNPKIIVDKANIKTLKQQLKTARSHEAGNRYLQLLATYQADQAYEAKLKILCDADEAASQAIRIKQNELERLTADLDSNQKSATQIGDKIKELKSFDDTTFAEIQVMEKASIESHPDGTKSRTLGMAAILGLLVGVGLALGLDVLDQRLRSADDARNLLQLPILGVLPLQPGRLSNAACGLVAHSDPMSDIAEAARSVRTAVYFASRTTPVKTVLIASPSKGDGKSVFASNLAIAMAQAGSRTLLIDADFRHPSLESIFDVQSGSGLSEVLAGRSPVDKAIRRTPIEGLEVLPCGPIPRNPSEMLNSQAFGKLIESLSERYQCILLDSPPAMSVTDARILGAMADVTLYVVRTGQTSRKAADQGLDLLLSVGSRVLGAVVNGVPAGRASRRAQGGLRLWDTFGADRSMGSALSPGHVNAGMNGNGMPQIAGSLGMGHLKQGQAKQNQPSQSTDHPEVDVLD